MAMPVLQNPYFPLSSNSALSNRPMHGVFDSGVNGTAKFPHTRAQLSAIVRQYRPTENYDSDAENEEYIKVPQVLLNEVVSLLVDEKEDELKAVLKSNFGVDEETAEQNVLDLMHKHRDDVAGVPFLFLTPTRRPISRPSSRASSHSTRLHAARPDTPTSAPSSPLVHVFRRPHTPATSPLAPYSPSSSPVLSHATVTTQAQWTASLPASPISSPRLLSAKASEFRPIPRPLSAAATHSAGFLLRADTPSPSPDLWAHNSPRATSNLAIAAPLIAESSPSRPGTPSSVVGAAGGAGGALRSNRRLQDDLDEEDDPFDPFASNPLSSFHSITISDFDTFDSHPWPPAPGDPNQNPNGYPGHYPAAYAPGYGVADMNGQVISSEGANPEDAAMLADGMTPFDVLSSVFGSTLAPSELEEALAVNSYDFDRAMAWLIDRTLPPGGMPSPPSAAVQGGPGGRIQNMGGRVNVVSREAMGSLRDGAPMNGAGIRGGFGAQAQAQRAPRYVNGRPVPSGNRVCRYFVAGECLRADCRFSHDLERALCRFWLRGTCAKQESCEFLHHLPKDVDVNALHAMLARNNVPPGTGPLASHVLPNNNTAPIDEFPALGYDATQAGRARKFTLYNDPSRTRFATAVKKPATPQDAASPNGNGELLGSTNASTGTNANVAARREIMGTAADSLHHQSAIVAPRPSPRLKLHAPTLLPTLPTGEALNSLYMAYRARAIHLGAARNACLSRAAEAWRRGDGGGAKRFSREGHDLNAKMAVEMKEAAGGLVRERTRVAEKAVRARDANWSDDPGDRGVRGKVLGAGLGVCLGVGSGKSVGGGGGGMDTTPEERMEVILDLHGLHSNEATEVLELFLLSLEREHFYGLAYAIVGEEKHTGTQDVARGASRARLAAGVREWLHRWGYPWSERDGIICIDPLTHASE